MKIVINSHIRSYRALPHLLESMKIPEEFKDFEIIVFIGGYYDLKTYETEKVDGFTIIRCNHNSIDFTGLISLSELFSDNIDEYYFYMHDTCKIGNDFYKKLNSIDLTNASTIKIHKLYSMNMGVYSQRVINHFKPVLFNLKNTDESRSMEFKKKGLDYEDFIFKNDTNNITLGDYNDWIHGDPVDYYQTGTMRIVEYHPNLDLFKIKANGGEDCILTLNN